MDNLDGNWITSGTISIERLPQGALERCIIVQDDGARFKLTSSQIQLGDTVKVESTNKMYYVIDTDRLSSEAGYTVYTAGIATEVPWAGVTGKPGTFPPSSHTHREFDGKVDKGGYTGTAQNLKNYIDRVDALRFSNVKYLPNGLPDVDSIKNLGAGIYSISDNLLFELSKGYWNVIRFGNANFGDSHVMAIPGGTSERGFFLGAFNSNRWTGWVKFHNCPYNIGDIYITTNTTNPAEIWKRTTWEKIEGSFLYGTAANHPGVRGGSNTVQISKNNLPAVKLKVDSFALSRGTMNITGSFGSPTKEGKPTATGAFRVTGDSYSGRAAGGGNGSVSWDFDASRSWTGTTSSASPYTEYLGTSKPLDIMPPYFTVNIWKRVS